MGKTSRQCSQESLFGQMDLNKDGVVSREEFSSAFRNGLISTPLPTQTRSEPQLGVCLGVGRSLASSRAQSLPSGARSRPLSGVFRRSRPPSGVRSGDGSVKHGVLSAAALDLGSNSNRNADDLFMNSCDFRLRPSPSGV